MKRELLAIATICTVFSATPLRADIYRQDGDNDVVLFTDSPREKGYQLIQKEQRSRSKAIDAKSVARETAPKSASAASGSISRTLPIQGRITSPTGLRTDPFNGKLKHHNGLDIAAPLGTPVKPVAPGTVIFSGWKGGYGNTVILDHNDGMVTVYAHHASNNVSEGESVDMGTVIALSGSSGRSTGPHLHFEAWRSGVNITQEFMPGSNADSQEVAAKSAPIRRYLQADGTIIFSNMR